MGQYIVRRKLEEPNKHSRLWIDDEIKDIPVSDQGTNEAIRCIKLIKLELNPGIVMKGLGNMKKLRFLQVYHRGVACFDSKWKLDEVHEYFPNALRCLRWSGYPFGSLPKPFQANNLVELDMRYSEVVQLWEAGDRKVLDKLKFLDLSYSNLKNLDLGLTPNLEILGLEGCKNLVQLHMPVECPKLTNLKLSHSRLTTLDLWRTPKSRDINYFRVSWFGRTSHTVINLMFDLWPRWLGFGSIRRSMLHKPSAMKFIISPLAYPCFNWDEKVKPFMV